MPTIFSRIVAGEIPCYKIAEDEKYFAFLDINPLAEGHTLVIPKAEGDYIFDIAIPCKRVGVAVMGLEVPHTHIHLIPINKETDMYFSKEKLKVSSEKMEKIAASIASKIK